MIDKIAEILKQCRQYSCNTEFAPPPFDDKPYDPKMINEVFPNKILTLISEEIEKELNGREEDMIADVDYKEGWLDCRHWILALFKEV